MPRLLKLTTFSSDAGNLSVFEKLMPGAIRRLFYIYGAADTQRGGHRHRHAWNALICVQGQCQVVVDTESQEYLFQLDQPDTCLLLEPGDWHQMQQFSHDAILLVLSNEYYDPADYLTDRYHQPLSQGTSS
jgi:dTDP-4-dehydrorhamnose 3,5-epimerase-like enzyme